MLMNVLLITAYHMLNYIRVTGDKIEQAASFTLQPPGMIGQELIDDSS
jgi:hypothetical protein